MLKVGTSQVVSNIPAINQRCLGETVFSSLPLNDPCLQLYNGSIIYDIGIYSKFVQYIQGLYRNMSCPNAFCDEETWQASVSKYGVCGKYVVNENSVRIPKIMGIIEGTLDIAALNNLVEAGLPNITGRVTGYEQWGSQSGAFYFGGYTGGTRVKYESGGGYGVIMDASRSNAIYGKSNTVQPQTIKQYIYVVVASDSRVVKNDTALDDNTAQILETLNASKDVIYSLDEAQPKIANINNAMDNVQAINIAAQNIPVIQSQIQVLQQQIEEVTQKLTVTASLDEQYPVGAIYLSVTETCPLAAFFGTWEKVSSGTVLQGSDASHAVGTTIAAGLPNIKGGFSIEGSNMKFSGNLFYLGDSVAGKNSAPDGSNDSWLYFDASRSNSIYGNSTTVQPPAYVVNIWQRTA